MISVKSLSDLATRRGGSALTARLRHIDDRLVWFGFVRITDHAAKFGISDVQGKIDLSTYRNLSDTPPPERKPGPRNLRTNRDLPGVYERPAAFAPLFACERTLDDLIATKLPDASTKNRLDFDQLVLPKRNVIPDSVRPVLASTELKNSCSITYQSLTSKESTVRTICPHALVKASGRWHVRAFDFSRRRFVDFSLSRILESEELLEHPAVPAELDDDWHANVAVEFIPHPDLSPQQKRAVAREYGMTSMAMTITVRRAMLFYLLDETRLLNALKAPGKSETRGAGLWLRNPRFVSGELTKMNFEE